MKLSFPVKLAKAFFLIFNVSIITYTAYQVNIGEATSEKKIESIFIILYLVCFDFLFFALYLPTSKELKSFIGIELSSRFTRFNDELTALADEQGAIRKAIRAEFEENQRQDKEIIPFESENIQEIVSAVRQASFVKIFIGIDDQTLVKSLAEALVAKKQNSRRPRTRFM